LFEHLLLALSNAALACFLAGYQVHEKSVLLPLLPMQVSSVASSHSLAAAFCAHARSRARVRTRGCSLALALALALALCEPRLT
jgi:hypothetical protein